VLALDFALSPANGSNLPEGCSASDEIEAGASEAGREGCRDQSFIGCRSVALLSGIQDLRGAAELRDVCVLGGVPLSQGVSAFAETVNHNI